MPAPESVADSAVSGARKFTSGVTGRNAHHHLLLTEYLLFCLFVVIRWAADYVPGDDGAAKGSALPSTGQDGPLPVWAAGTGVFFLLSFPAARGGAAAAAATAFGALVILTLAMRSGTELSTVAGWYANIAQATTAANASPVTRGGTGGGGGTTT